MDALSAEQQGQVSNLSVLVQAEAAYAALMEDTALLPVEELRQRYTQTLQDSPVYGNEWDIINLCRFGLAEDDIREHYCDSVRQALEETGSAVFSRTRSTVNAGVVTALTACGVDAADFYGYDLTAPLCEAEYVQKQGLNGVVYALLALDTHDYAADTAIRETFLSVILNAQEPDGGWTIDTWSGVEDGSDADMTAMTDKFKKAISECGIETANFHALRHTFATRCVELGFDIKSLSEILGHSSVNITLNRYVHPSMELKQQNMNKLSELLAVK